MRVTLAALLLLSNLSRAQVTIEVLSPSVGQYETALDGLSKAVETITNYPAYRAACFAILGDQIEAQREYELFEREYRDKIAFGREPTPGEALTWAVQVEPFRRIEDSKRMPEALSQAGIVTVDVDRAIQLREKQMVRPAGIAAPAGNRFQCDCRESQRPI